MKILITNHDLAQYGGTQSWVLEACRVLSKDHTVDVFCFVGHGEVFDRIGEYARDRYVATVPGGDYDLILVNHNTCMQVVEHLPGTKIYTQHGPTHSVEQYYGGADLVVAVSPEVQAVLMERGIEATVIGNGIDTDRFYHAPWPPSAPPVVLSLCKGLRGQDMVKNACEAAGLPHKTIHYKTNGTLAVEDAIRDADIVVGYGRCILEAMACGKAAFVFDARGIDTPRGDGWVTATNVDKLARVNFSGRHTHTPYTVNTLVGELQHPPSQATRDTLSTWVHLTAHAGTQFDHYLHLKEQFNGTYATV